jgi:signal transduction histidine kinase
MSMHVLIIASMAGTAESAASIARQLGAVISVASSRGEGLAVLRRMQFDVIVVEESLVESDSEWADRIWQNASNAMPVVVNFARSGRLRLAREVGAALARRASDKTLARRAATDEIANDLKSPLTGLLLHSELALRDPSMPLALQPKLLHLVELAGAIRMRLGPRAPVAV